MGARGFTSCVEKAKRFKKSEADAWSQKITAISVKLRGEGFLTYAEQAAELNRLGERTVRGTLWTAQSVYISCRHDRRAKGGRKLTSREVHELVDGRWRDQLRDKVLELKRFGATRYADIAKTLNKEGVTTRLGQQWSEQSVYRLMRGIGLPTGKPGRRRRDE
jgi:hypothetical protein